MPHKLSDTRGDSEYWNKRCSEALIALEDQPMRVHHLSALAILAEDIALELASEASHGLSTRLRLV